MLETPLDPKFGERGEMISPDARQASKGSRKRNQKVWLSTKLALNTAFALFLVTTGCDRQSGSPVRIHLHDVPETRSQPGTTRETRPWSCPPGDPDGNDASSSPAEGHIVNVSWNPSPSSGKPKRGQISYCLYRSKSQPIQSS